jgi:hypothetical protein
VNARALAKLNLRATERGFVRLEQLYQSKVYQLRQYIIDDLRRGWERNRLEEQAVHDEDFAAGGYWENQWLTDYECVKVWRPLTERYIVPRKKLTTEDLCEFEKNNPAAYQAFREDILEWNFVTPGAIGYDGVTDLLPRVHDVVAHAQRTQVVTELRRLLSNVHLLADRVLARLVQRLERIQTLHQETPLQPPPLEYRPTIQPNAPAL